MTALRPMALVICFVGARGRARGVRRASGARLRRAQLVLEMEAETLRFE